MAHLDQQDIDDVNAVLASLDSRPDKDQLAYAVEVNKINSIISDLSSPAPTLTCMTGDEVEKLLNVEAPRIREEDPQLPETTAYYMEEEFFPQQPETTAYYVYVNNVEAPKMIRAEEDPSYLCSMLRPPR